MHQTLAIIVILVLTGVHLTDATLNAEILFNEFTKVFPVKDGGGLVSPNHSSVFLTKALMQLDFMGIPHNITQFCALPEDKIIQTFMLAALGNMMVNTTDGDRCTTPFVTDTTSGEILRANTFANNRILIFRVIIFSLLLALAHAWYVIQTNTAQQSTVKK